MAERWSDERLEVVVASVGRHLVVPEGVAVVPRLGVPPALRRGSRLLLAAAAVALVILLAAVALLTPAGEAVADWLGIGSTSIEQVPRSQADPTGLPRLAAGAVEVDRTAARARLGRPLPVVPRAALGAPRYFLIPEGGVLMAWADGRTTLWVRPDDGEVAITVKKLAGFTEDARPVPRLGDTAILVDGPHVLQTPSRRVGAGRVVLWLDDGLQLRLESDLPRDRLIAIARAVRVGA